MTTSTSSSFAARAARERRGPRRSPCARRTWMWLERAGSAHQTRLSLGRRCAACERAPASRAGASTSMSTVSGLRSTPSKSLSGSTVWWFRSSSPRQKPTGDRRGMDTTFVLHDGAPDADAVARLQANAAAGRARPLARRSPAPLQRAVVRPRRAGAVRSHNPMRPLVEATGYLMRTTAVWRRKLGSGRPRSHQGPCRVRQSVPRRDADRLSHPPFTVDNLSSISPAARVGGVSSSRFARRFGIGNVTGLGMAPFRSATRHFSTDGWRRAKPPRPGPQP